MVLRKFIIPKQSLYKHLHFNGDFHVDIDGQHSFEMRHYGYEIENEVFWNGVYDGWEKVSLQLWGELCKDANTVLDVGANTGIYTLLTKAINPAATIHSFEPVKRVYDRLLHNVALNNYEVSCVGEALSNFNGKATIYDKDTPHTYSVTVNKDTSVDMETSVAVEIETMRLDTYIESNGIKAVDVIKLDVETHEAEVLEGMGKYLEAFQPTFLIEILNEEVAGKISELIDGMGYEYYNIDENGFIRKVSKLTTSDYYNFLLCKKEISKRLKTLKKYCIQ